MNDEINICVLTEGVNTGFTMICGVLVILMQLGFAMVESGLNSSRHTANILFKNLADLSIGAICFYLVGYNLMWPENSPDGFWNLPSSEHGTHWFYQMAFAATAATIVSGAVAGRMKFKAYLIFSAVLAGVVYPLIGRICWSETSPISDHFHDFAGSIVVHVVGGAAALAAIVVLRPRVNRFTAGADSIRHHSLPFVLLGTLLLWVGWYGFNGGSVGELITSDNSGSLTLSFVLINTTLGAAGGTIGGMLSSIAFRKEGKVDLRAALNGCLGGLVAITAGCDVIPSFACLIAGILAGVLVYGIENLFELKKLKKLELDDTVGAVAVHGGCGILGGLLAGWFDKDIKFWEQFLIILAVLVTVFSVMWVVFKVINKIGFLEVEKEDEIQGLDIIEHNLVAYNYSSPSELAPTTKTPKGERSQKRSW